MRFRRTEKDYFGHKLVTNPALCKIKGATVARNPLELLVAGVRFELTTFGL